MNNEEYEKALERGINKFQRGILYYHNDRPDFFCYKYNEGDELLVIQAVMNQVSQGDLDLEDANSIMQQIEENVKNSRRKK